MYSYGSRLGIRDLAIMAVYSGYKDQLSSYPLECFIFPKTSSNFSFTEKVINDGKEDEERIHKVI